MSVGNYRLSLHGGSTDDSHKKAAEAFQQSFAARRRASFPTQPLTIFFCDTLHSFVFLRPIDSAHKASEKRHPKYLVWSIHLLWQKVIQSQRRYRDNVLTRGGLLTANKRTAINRPKRWLGPDTSRGPLRSLELKVFWPDGRTDKTNNKQTKTKSSIFFFVESKLKTRLRVIKPKTPQKFPDSIFQICLIN